MAYRRYKGYKKKSRSITCSYEEIIDFNTDGGSISVMGIHTPDDDTPRKMFPGLFQQFKHYKYLGCKVVGANAAQLPVDPMSVGYEAGEEVGATIDPRDVFDPILFHGCHGEDLGAVLNRLYTSGTVDEITASLNGFTESDDALDMGRPEVLEGLFYKALTDRTWRKFPIQGGIRLNGLHPLVYNLATNHYISPNVQGAEFYDATNGTIDGFSVPDAISNATGVSVERDTRFFTPSLRRLGWMDTRLPYMASSNNLPSGDPDEDDAYADWLAKLQSTTNYARMPRIFMGVLLIPKSRRVKQFIRMRIVHYFKFAGFRGASMDVNMLGAPSFYEVGNDYGNAVSNDDEILGGNPDEPTPEPTPEPTGPYIGVKLLSPDIVGDTSRLSDVYYQIIDQTTSTTLAEKVGGEMLGYHKFDAIEGHTYKINVIANEGTAFVNPYALVSVPQMTQRTTAEYFVTVSSLSGTYDLDIKLMNLGTSS